MTQWSTFNKQKKDIKRRAFTSTFFLLILLSVSSGVLTKLLRPLLSKAKTLPLYFTIFLSFPFFFLILFSSNIRSFFLLTCLSKVEPTYVSRFVMLC